MFYYVTKMGAYNHGVFGIFEDLDEAKKLADFASIKDEDGYHEWTVLEYKPPNDDTDYTIDSNHKVVYRSG